MGCTDSRLCASCARRRLRLPALQQTPRDARYDFGRALVLADGDRRLDHDRQPGRTAGGKLSSRHSELHARHGVILPPNGPARGKAPPTSGLVATFWLVLALPAFEVWLTRPGQSIEAAAARSMLLLVLLGVSLGNLAPTTHRFAGIAIVFGQWLLIAPWISYAGYDLPAADYWGRTICLAGLLAALLRPRREYPGASEFDRVWLAYRDLFGGLWALRIAERFNAYLAERPKADGSEDSAQVTLRLGGLTTLDGQPAPAEAASDEDWLAFNNLLRRFVCDDWVHARKEPRIR